MALHPKTEVLLADGRTAPLHDLKPGDQLMGNDSSPICLTEITPVERDAFELIPKRGHAFVADGEQVIVLAKGLGSRKASFSKKRGRMVSKHRHIPNIVPCHLRDFISRSRSFKRRFFLVKQAVQFKSQPVPFDPYLLGIWLGDGLQRKVGIANTDREVIDYVYQVAASYGLRVYENVKKKSSCSSFIIVRGNVSGHGRHKNPLLNLFKSLGLIREKHIPSVFLQNDEGVRLTVLAGLVDTDGYVKNGVLYITQKRERLIHDIKRLADSLGFRTRTSSAVKKIKSTGFSGRYFQLSISGDLNRIPVKIGHKRSRPISDRYDRKMGGFQVKSRGKDKLLQLSFDRNLPILLADGTLVGSASEAPGLDSYLKNVEDQWWHQRLAEVKAHIEKTGLRPNHPDKKAQWLKKQETLAERNQLPPDKAKLLEGLNTSNQDRHFELMVNRLLRFRQLNPGKKPKFNLVFEGVNLGYWCGRQREFYRMGKLSPQRIERLQSIGFPLKTRRAKGEN
ncbi:MAG: Helicase associated domain protein [Cyclobacteriaceae bacterium]|jgi:replicative DNA helicase|nr:Helicase associated domain protein [Flammeovirgaceae bacterium]